MHDKLYQNAICYTAEENGQLQIYLKKDATDVLTPELKPVVSAYQLEEQFPDAYHTSSILNWVEKNQNYFLRIVFIDIKYCKDVENWQKIDAKIFKNRVNQDQTVAGKTIKKHIFRMISDNLPKKQSTTDPKKSTWSVYILPCAHDENGALHLLFEKGIKTSEFTGILAGENITINPTDLRTETAEKKLAELGFKKGEYLGIKNYYIDDNDINNRLYLLLTRKIEIAEKFIWAKDVQIDQLHPEGFNSIVNKKNTDGENVLTWCKKIFAKAEQFYQHLEFYLKMQNRVWTVFLQPNMEPSFVIQEKSALNLAKNNISGALYSSDIFTSLFGGGRLWRLHFLDGADFALTNQIGIPASMFTETYADIVIGDKKLNKDVALAIYHNLPTAIQAAEKAAKQKPGEELEDTNNNTLIKLTEALQLLNL